jgi:tetratricopeptide (TPR) repeat protein
VAEVFVHRGRALTALGQNADAEVALGRALEILGSANHAAPAIEARALAAQAALFSSRPAKALQLYLRAAEIDRKEQGAQLWVARDMVGVGEMKLAARQPGAVAVLEEALQMAEEAQALPSDVAAAQFALARALAVERPSDDRGVRLARQARETWAGQPWQAGRVAEADALLRKARPE